MRAHEFIEGMYNKGGGMVRGIDPLADTMPGLFGRRKKGKEIPDAPDAPYSKYPKTMYGTDRMITPAQRDALEGDGQFKMLRELWLAVIENEKKKAKKRGNRYYAGNAGDEQRAIHELGNYRDKLLQHLGLPSIY